MILEILLGLLLLSVAVWYYKYTKLNKYLSKFRGPTPLPFLGNFLQFYSGAILLERFLKYHKQYGSVVKLSLGEKLMVLSIADVKLIEFVLSSTKLIDKSIDYRFLHRWLGLGLLTSTGERWKKHRKMITPAYHFKILEQFGDVFETYSNILIENLRKDVDKPSTDIYPYVNLCSLDIICASSMGTKVNAQEDSESLYVQSVKELGRIVIERAFNAIEMNDYLYVFCEDYKKELKAVKILHNFTNNVIRSRFKELEQEKKNNEETVGIDGDVKQKKTLLDLLINYKLENQLISDENIREEVDTFMFEGHDTTSSGISFSLYCVANNPDVQIKIVEELVSIFGDDMTRPATYKDLQEMKYLEKVIKESLRIYPSVPIYGRSVSENTKYEDIILPKGLTLFINAFVVHRDPKIYPDPEKFDPERFNLENMAKRSPYAYIPFSAGPRNCIGQKFAMLEMKAVISKVLKNYELLPSMPQKNLLLITETILKSSNGINIRLKKRKFNSD